MIEFLDKMSFHPIVLFMVSHEVIFFGVGNFTVVQSFAFIAMAMFCTQIVSGLLLVATLDLAIENCWLNLQ